MFQDTRQDDNQTRNRKRKYEERFDTIVKNGLVALGIAIGHKAGLFKALRRCKDPVTSQELANVQGYKERYVREWLGSMVAAELVYITEDNKYHLPFEQPDTEASEVFSLLLPGSAKRIDDLCDCLKEDGPKGFTYDKQPDILEFLGEQKQMFTGSWINDNFPHSVISKDKIKSILDIGCGTGRLTINIANHFPDAFVTGIDPTKFAIDKANKIKTDENVKNVEFLQVGVEVMSDDWTNKFDLAIAIQVLHDLPDPVESIKSIRRVLKDGGVLSAQDPDVHSDPKDNVGLQYPAAMLVVSCCCCLPSSMSTEPAVGNGIGWGLENRAKFLTFHGFEIIGKKHTDMIHCRKI